MCVGTQYTQLLTCRCLAGVCGAVTCVAEYFNQAAKPEICWALVRNWPWWQIRVVILYLVRCASTRFWSNISISSEYHLISDANPTLRSSQWVIPARWDEISHISDPKHFKPVLRLIYTKHWASSLLTTPSAYFTTCVVELKDNDVVHVKHINKETGPDAQFKWEITEESGLEDD